MNTCPAYTGYTQADTDTHTGKQTGLQTDTHKQVGQGEGPLPLKAIATENPQEGDILPEADT